MLLTICYANTSSQWCDVCPLCRRHNIIHVVNITAAGNIICPWGQISFSVNAPLRASRYWSGYANWILSQKCDRATSNRKGTSPRKTKSPGQKTGVFLELRLRSISNNTQVFIENEDTHAWGLRASSTRSARSMRTGLRRRATKPSSNRIAAPEKPKALVFRPGFFWSCYPDSNWGPHPYQGCALPTEP